MHVGSRIEEARLGEALCALAGRAEIEEPQKSGCIKLGRPERV